MPDTVFNASLVAVRGWELFCMGLWLLGFWLVSRHGRTRFLFGIYVGATLCALLWDWILGSSWFFRITFDDRFVMLYTIDGRPEPLWAPLSYGFFFGITSLVALRYRRRLDASLGRWQFVVIPVLLGLADILIEGTTVGALDLYVFEYRPQWLVFGVPHTNVLFVAVTEFCILYAARGMGELLERAGVPAISADQARPGTGRRSTNGQGGTATLTRHVVDVTPLKRPWGPFLIGLLIPSGAIYIGVIVTTFVLNAVIKPW